MSPGGEDHVQSEDHRRLEMSTDIFLRIITIQSLPNLIIPPDSMELSWHRRVRVDCSRIDIV